MEFLNGEARSVFFQPKCPGPCDSLREDWRTRPRPHARSCRGHPEHSPLVAAPVACVRYGRWWGVGVLALALRVLGRTRREQWVVNGGSSLNFSFPIHSWGCHLRPCPGTGTVLECRAAGPVLRVSKREKERGIGHSSWWLWEPQQSPESHVWDHCSQVATCGNVTQLGCFL